MRIGRVLAVTAVVLVLMLGMTAAHALWGVSRPGPSVQVRTGSLSVMAAWVGTPPVWPALAPGGTTSDATVRITGTGAGNTLGWDVSVTASFPAAATPHISTQAWIGGCGSTTPLAASTFYPGTGTPLTPAQTLDVCLRFTLAASAPVSLAGQSLAPTILVTARQRST